MSSLKKASSLQSEYRKEAQKRAAAEARFAQARDERQQLEAQLKALQRGVEISFGGGAAGGYGDRSPRSPRGRARHGRARLGDSRYAKDGGRTSPRASPRRRRTEVCLICHKELASEKYDAHAERCVVKLVNFIQAGGNAVGPGSPRESHSAVSPKAGGGGGGRGMISREEATAIMQQQLAGASPSGDRPRRRAESPRRARSCPH